MLLDLNTSPPVHLMPLAQYARACASRATMQQSGGTVKRATSEPTRVTSPVSGRASNRKLGERVQWEGKGLFVGGRWIDDGVRVEVVDKYSGDPITSVRIASPEHVHQAVTAAVRTVEHGPPPAWQRQRILERGAALLSERRDTIVSTYVAETGFTVRDAETELVRACDTLRLCGQESARLAGEVIPVASTVGSEQRFAFTIRVPVGVVGAIAPFNAPLNTVAHKIGPAIAAGNAVVLKPALTTPLSSIHLCEALTDAGLPPGYLNLVIGPGDTTGQELVIDKRVRYFTFTGSTEVGLSIKQRSGIAKTHLELGSNSATIVCADADLALAAELIVRAGYRKAGQVCTSVQRVLADRRVAEELEGALLQRVKGLRLGDPRLPGTDVGPMIAPSEAERAVAWVTEAVDTGARLLTGGTRSGSLMEPTLLADVPDQTRLMCDEVFAPVVALRTVDGLDEAITIANSTRYGLQAGVFTRDIGTALSAVWKLRVGGVMVNDTSSYHADLMPYGGVKDSGYGVEGPKYAVTDMTDVRTVVVSPGTL